MGFCIIFVLIIPFPQFVYSFDFWVKAHTNKSCFLHRFLCIGSVLFATEELILNLVTPLFNSFNSVIIIIIIFQCGGNHAQKHNLADIKQHKGTHWAQWTLMTLIREIWRQPLDHIAPGHCSGVWVLWFLHQLHLCASALVKDYLWMAALNTSFVKLRHCTVLVDTVTPGVERLIKICNEFGLCISTIFSSFQVTVNICLSLRLSFDLKPLYLFALSSLKLLHERI